MLRLALLTGMAGIALVVEACGGSTSNERTTPTGKGGGCTTGGGSGVPMGGASGGVATGGTATGAVGGVVSDAGVGGSGGLEDSGVPPDDAGLWDVIYE